MHCGNGSEGCVDISVCVLDEGDVIGCDVQSSAQITSQLRVELNWFYFKSEARGSLPHAHSRAVSLQRCGRRVPHTPSLTFSLSAGFMFSVLVDLCFPSWSL